MTFSHENLRKNGDNPNHVHIPLASFKKGIGINSAVWFINEYQFVVVVVVDILVLGIIVN